MPDEAHGTRGRRIVRRAALGLVLVAAAAAGWFVVDRRPVTVVVAEAESNVAVRVFGLGTVEAQVLSKVGFEIGATLAEVAADHGERVVRGQPLARLSSDEQEARVAKARAALLVAEAGKLRAAAGLARATVVLEQKADDNRRKRDLVGRDAVARQVAEDSARDEAVAAAEVAMARSEIEIAAALAEDARAQLSIEEIGLAHRTLVAPYDAIVIARHAEPGTVIRAGDPIFTLVAVGTYWGLAYVDEARAGFIAEGQEVEARIRSRPQEVFSGRVVRIGLESDRVTEERRIYVRGQNPPPTVFLGEQVEFWITVAHLDRAILVPEAAVTGFDGREGRVWTVEDGALQIRALRFGHRTEDARLEIAGGLPEGARVVATPRDGLREGRRARIAVAAAP